MPKQELPDCPIEVTLALIGNRWKVLILRELQETKRRFNELLRSLPGISQKVLTSNLRSMESDGLVTRTIYAEVPPRVEYALTETGISLRVVLDVMAAWGEEYRATHQWE